MVEGAASENVWHGTQGWYAGDPTRHACRLLVRLLFPCSAGYIPHLHRIFRLCRSQVRGTGAAVQFRAQ